MKVIRKVLGFVGAAVYSAVLCLLLYQLFFWVTPWFMSQPGWFVVFVWVVVIPMAGFAFAGLAGLIISLPLSLMTNGVRYARVIPTLIMLFLGFKSAQLPWLMEGEYTTLMVVLAVTMSIIAAGTFIECIVIMHTTGDE